MRLAILVIGILLTMGESGTAETKTLVLKLGTSEPTPRPSPEVLEALAKTDNEKVKEKERLEKEKEEHKEEEKAKKEAEKACLPNWKEFTFGKILAPGSGVKVNPMVLQMQDRPPETDMISGIMMNLGNYPGDRASQEMITKYKDMHSAAEKGSEPHVPNGNGTSAIASYAPGIHESMHEF